MIMYDAWWLVATFVGGYLFGILAAVVWLQ
jgi:hypothetical protein